MNRICNGNIRNGYSADESRHIQDNSVNGEQGRGTLTSVFTVAVVDEDASEGSGALAVITDGASNAVTSLSAGNFTAKAVIPKNTENATVILAKYSGNELKELKLSSAVSKTDADFTVKETETISVLESEVQSVKLKVFVFESMQTIKPLCKQEEI